MRKSGNQIGSVVEFNELKSELIETKKELWKEKTSKEALQLAHSRADMALAVSLSTEKERADCLENEYILAALKIKQLEESLRYTLLNIFWYHCFKFIQFSLYEANQQIYSSPARSHLERHNEKIMLLHQQNHEQQQHTNRNTNRNTNLETSLVTESIPQSPKPSLLYSTYVTPTKSSINNESKYDLVVNIPKSAVEFPLNSSIQNGQNNQEVISSPINMENILDELIHSKLLLASLAAELQEEKHVVHILSRANQKYAEKVIELFYNLYNLFK